MDRNELTSQKCAMRENHAYCVKFTPTKACENQEPFISSLFQRLTRLARIMPSVGIMMFVAAIAGGASQRLLAQSDTPTDMLIIPPTRLTTTNCALPTDLES